MVATSAFLPFEIWELAVGHVTWLKVTAFVINLALVIYLVWTRRLFGVRGGKAAYEARLRSESLIEVEHAALVQTSSGQAGRERTADAGVPLAADAPVPGSVPAPSPASSTPPHPAAPPDGTV